MVPTHARARAWSITLGVLLIILGIVATSAPVFVSLIFIKLLLILAAVEQAVYAVQSRGENTFLLIVLLAVVYGVIALMLLFRPVGGTMAVTVIIATLFLLDGIMEIALGVQMHRQGRRSQWLFIGGIVSLAFAGSILYRFPSSAGWTLGLLVGIRMFVKGIEQLTRWTRGVEPRTGTGTGKRAA
jgi:uncharacterized membrane protein HdeD (DUF308 family)